jgi:hypothetical protein
VATINTLGFRIWLEEIYGLKKKSAGDAVSRFNRALDIRGSDQSLVIDNQLDLFIKNLRINPEFQSLPDSSRAGILRSLNLYKKYVSR